MIVCICNQVSDREIKRCVRAGMDFSDIQLELGVATCCGSCESCARDIVARVQADMRAETPRQAPPQRPASGAGFPAFA